MATYMGSSQRNACCSEAIIWTIAIWKALQLQRQTVKHCFNKFHQDKHIIYDVLQAHVFETESKCVAFLVNFNQHQTSKAVFRNISLQLAPKSISILSDCRRVVFETAKVIDLHSVLRPLYLSREITSPLLMVFLFIICFTIVKCSAWFQNSWSSTVSQWHLGCATRWNLFSVIWVVPVKKVAWF